MSSELTEILRTEHSSEDGGKEIQLPETVPEMFLATVAGVNAEGVQITLDGESNRMFRKEVSLSEPFTKNDELTV